MKWKGYIRDEKDIITRIMFINGNGYDVGNNCIRNSR